MSSTWTCHQNHLGIFLEYYFIHLYTGLYAVSIFVCIIIDNQCLDLLLIPWEFRMFLILIFLLTLFKKAKEILKHTYKKWYI